MRPGESQGSEQFQERIDRVPTAAAIPISAVSFGLLSQLLMSPLSHMLISMDVGDLGHEVRRLFDELGRRHPERRQMVSGECMPLQDVFETDRSIEIVLDLPGVSRDSCRILIKSGVVLVVGEKERAEPSRGPASFHLVERDFGRFARAVRIHSAIDASNARARLKDGELRIVLPKVAERRGREIAVAIDTDDTPPAG